MKTAVPIILAVLLAGPAIAADDYSYQGSFLWNDIRAIAPSNGYLFCAFHDGVGVINLALDFTKKKLYSSLELDNPPGRIWVFDTMVIVEAENGRIDLVSAADPRNLRRLGSFTPDRPLLDIECLGSYLYAAVEYDGVCRYDISDPEQVVWNDSSMAGIHVLALAAEGGRLYALDDYNGVLIYQPQTAGIGQPVGELLLPYSGVSLSVSNDTVFCGMRPTGFMIGETSDSEHTRYLGRRETYIRADLIATIPGGVVLANAVGGFELISIRDTDTLDQLYPMVDLSGAAAVYSHQGRPFLIYPHERYGFVAYDIGDPDLVQTEYPALVYAYPGPITQLEFFQSRLHVVGTNNWYEIYDVSDPGRPIRSGRMINPPYRPAGVCAKGDTLFVADIAYDAVFPFVDDGVGDPYSIFPLFTVADSITRPHLIPDFFSDGDLLYFSNDRVFNGTARNDSEVFPNRLHWSFSETMTAALLYEAALYRVTDKGILRMHRVRQVWGEYSLQDAGFKMMPGRINQLLIVDTFMYAAGPGLLTLSVADPFAPVLLDAAAEPGTVYEMRLDGTWLICAARQGIYIYDLSAGLPQLYFSGGTMARTVARDGERLAASDGYSVKVYLLPEVSVDDWPEAATVPVRPRLVGAPNPFNATIRLSGSGFSTRSGLVAVEVYDILGRRVRRLAAVAAGGDVQAVWDGREENGAAAASGVYFFRAGAGSEQTVFKAVLLK